MKTDYNKPRGPYESPGITGVDNYYGKVLNVTRDLNLRGKKWTPIGTQDRPFKGDFDGGIVKDGDNNLVFFRIGEDSRVIPAGTAVVIVANAAKTVNIHGARR